MSRSTFLAVVASLVAPFALHAQATQAQGEGEGDPTTAALAGVTTPSACAQALSKYVYGAYKAAEAAKRPIGADSVKQLTRVFAERCVTRVASRASNAELPTLARLYGMAGQPARADSITERSIAVAATPAQRAAALAEAAIAHSGTPEVEARYSAALDALPLADALPMQFEAHRQLLAHYRHEDNDAAIFRHARAVIALVPLVPVAARASAPLGEALLTAYKNLAEVHADEGHADSSLAVLARAEREIPWVKDLTKELAEPKLRYSLVGRPAPAIDGKIWINAPAGTATAPIAGKIGIVQFTATWCPPCKRSYPELRAVSEQFAGKPVQLVLHTTLYGNFEGREVTDAEEIAADREYFISTQKLDVPIGIQVDHLKHDAQGKMVFENMVDDRYGVTDIPTTIVVDRAGVVRRILTGWDAGNARRITQLVNELLAEPARASQ